MKATLRLDMFGIITNKFDEMKLFYRDLMGLEVAFEMDNYVEFKTPGVRFAISTNKIMQEVTGHPSYKAAKQGQVLELAFILDSPELVDKAYKDILDKGAAPINAPADMPWGQRAAFFADPDGNIHELFANLPQDH